jgi:hypothetical protein
MHICPFPLDLILVNSNCTFLYVLALLPSSLHLCVEHLNLHAQYLQFALLAHVLELKSVNGCLEILNLFGLCLDYTLSFVTLSPKAPIQ